MKSFAKIKHSVVIAFIILALCGLHAAEASANSPEPSVAGNPYMGAPVELTKAPNGAIARKDLLDRINDAAWLKPTIENPAEGIYVFGGYAIAPIAIIETDAGLIAFDTGDAKHDGEILFKAIRTVSDKPIKVIIYGHSHTVHGAGVFAEGNKDIMIIAKPGLNERVQQDLASSGIPAFFPELGPYLMGRAVTQFNGYMPSKGSDAWVAPMTVGTPGSAFISANTLVEDGHEMTVLGVRMQFFTKYGSDDKYHTTVWLPDRKILFTTMLWSSPPQLYSLRGDLFRDPREWIAGLRFNMNLKPEVLISAAAKPIVGAEKIQQRLQDYMDGARFVLDQSLRGILHGVGPDDLRHFVKLPKYLDESPVNLQNYGEISSYAPAIFYYAVGWYDNDAANLKPLAPIDEARRLVPLMGGRDKVIAATKAALAKKEYAWAAKLANQLYLIDKQDKEACQLKADALRQMAYVSTGANDRAHLMSQALALEGKVTIARLIPPADEVVIASPQTFVDYFRVRIDPEKSVKTDKFLRFDFTNGTSVGLHVRRAVAEYVPEPDKYPRKPDIVLSMSPETWVKVYLSRAMPEDLIKNGDIKVTGDGAEAARVINLFDRYQPEKAVVIPPAYLEHDG
jgi:alkyl sulfatase BDS1-like metallo-beta-lactamase superfamily hydrolase